MKTENFAILQKIKKIRCKIVSLHWSVMIQFMKLLVNVKEREFFCLHMSLHGAELLFYFLTVDSAGDGF